MRPIEELIDEARDIVDMKVKNCPWGLLSELADALERLRQDNRQTVLVQSHLKQENGTLLQEVHLARERLGPAGWKMVQEVGRLRCAVAAARKLHDIAKPLGIRSREMQEIGKALDALEERRNKP